MGRRTRKTLPLMPCGSASHCAHVSSSTAAPSTSSVTPPGSGPTRHSALVQMFCASSPSHSALSALSAAKPLTRPDQPLRRSQREICVTTGRVRKGTNSLGAPVVVGEGVVVAAGGCSGGGESCHWPSPR